jgi:SAM-dependent methyltransferase
MRTVRACQVEIAATDAHPHYLEAYRHDEIYYWLHIPRWLEEDPPGRGPERCLDIGCGYGTLALYCKKQFGTNVWCTDLIDEYLSPGLIDRYQFAFQVSNVELDPVPWDLRFDVVLFTEVLEHLNFHPIPTLRKIRDRLSPDGRLYLSTPDGSAWGRETNRYSNYRDMPQPNRNMPIHDGHIYLYNQEELIDLCSSAGLEVVRVDHAPGIGARHINLTLAPK